jgi:hypothetical protein
MRICHDGENEVFQELILDEKFGMIQIYFNKTTVLDRSGPDP